MNLTRSLISFYPQFIKLVWQSVCFFHHPPGVYILTLCWQFRCVLPRESVIVFLKFPDWMESNKELTHCSCVSPQVKAGRLNKATFIKNAKQFSILILNEKVVCISAGWYPENTSPTWNKPEILIVSQTLASERPRFLETSVDNISTISVIQNS